MIENIFFLQDSIVIYCALINQYIIDEIKEQNRTISPLENRVLQLSLQGVKMITSQSAFNIGPPSARQ